jgi:hypothetical protein
VFGLVTRSAILLLDRFRQLEVEEGEAFGAGLVLRGARERLAPVVTTTFATTVVFLPVLIMGSRAGLELAQPVAVVFVGGLITSVVLNLFALPVLYLRFGFSRAAEREEAAQPEELTAVLDELARGGVAGGLAGGVPGTVTGGVTAMTDTRSVQDRVGD